MCTKHSKGFKPPLSAISRKIIDMAHYVTESPFFVFGVFTVFVFGIYFSNFFESSILRIWCV